MTRVTGDEARLLEALAKRGPSEVSDLESATELDQSRIVALAHEDAQDGGRGWLTLSSREREELIPADDAAAQLEAVLPERRAAAMLHAAGGSVLIGELREWAEASDVPLHKIFKHGGQRGWVRQQKDPGGDATLTRVILTDAGAAAVADGAEPQPDERAMALAVERAAEGRQLYLDELGAAGIDAKQAARLLKGRQDLAKTKRRKERVLALTDAGQAAVAAGLEVRHERNALTPEDIASGAWRQIDLRPYDVTLPAAEIHPAKIHPMRKAMEETRKAYLEMGFTEVVSPMVESAFWNFDALYQPQDHPARDMQDTFYMAEPAAITDRDMPAADVVERVRRTHEDGWETGSEGWGYRWNAETARRLVLRTHTTASTIRALAAHPEPPLKTFCVGWTYRNETISYKHLPVFHQVDGIVIDENANFASLLGMLGEFYRKMGFSQVRFKPAFYPYTEPSADVVVYLESRGKWMEMGGSGIFRPEVTEPLGCKHPVLAWGLGIERLAMVRFGLSGIRELYDGDIDRMQGIPLCR